MYSNIRVPYGRSFTSGSMGCQYLETLLSCCLFFQKARYAGLFTSIIYFSSAFIDQIVQDKGIGETQKNAASLIQAVAFYRMTNNLGKLEATGIGLSSETFNVVYENYRFSTGVIFLIFDFFLQLAIGLYLDKVWPQ